MLLPRDEIARRRYGEPRHVAIPLGVREHILTIFTLDDSRILDATRPLVLPLCVAVGIQHRRRPPREMQPVRTLGEPDARRVVPDRRIPRRVLGAVEDVHLSSPHDGGWIKRGVLLPAHDAVIKRRANRRHTARRDDWVHPGRLHEGTELPPGRPERERACA